MASQTTKTQHITLSDGRRLAYDAMGDQDGMPVFLFHGVPGSRLQRHPNAASVAERLGARVVAVDRPGYGLSDNQPGRTILHWPDDVAQLADALEIDRFAVIGVSGGGPFALACAHALPDRMTRLALVSSLAPIEAPGIRKSLVRSQRMQFTFANALPWVVRLMFRSYFRAAGKMSPEDVRSKLRKDLPLAERPLLDVPGFIEMFVADAIEAGRGGANAVSMELTLLARPWGFHVEDVTVPTLLWQGMEDMNVSPAMGRHLADVIPDCQATFLPGEGHLVGLTHWDKILQAVVA